MFRYDLSTFADERSRQFYPKADLPAPPRTWTPPTEVATHLEQVCRHHLGWRPHCVEPLPVRGTFHALYRLVPAQGTPVIARLGLDPDRRDYPLHLDRAVAPVLRLSGLPTLAVHAVDLTRNRAPFDYELLEQAPGRVLSEFDADDAAMKPHLVRLGVMLSQVHRIPMTGTGLLVPTGESACGACSSWSRFLDNHLDRHLAVCRSMGAITSLESRTIRGVFDRRLLEMDRLPSRLLHGDPGNHNIFVDDGAISCLIDWEDSVAGDPVFEVAFWATFHPERRHAAFLAGYLVQSPPEEDFLDRFWLYFLRIALAKTVLRHNLGILDHPDRPPASRRIQQGLAGVVGSPRFGTSLVPRRWGVHPPLAG